jgi:hypothetical protein
LDNRVAAIFLDNHPIGLAPGWRLFRPVKLHLHEAPDALEARKLARGGCFIGRSRNAAKRE